VMVLAHRVLWRSLLRIPQAVLRDLFGEGAI
jgi:hypothetical protein